LNADEIDKDVLRPFFTDIDTLHDRIGFEYFLRTMDSMHYCRYYLNQLKKNSTFFGKLKPNSTESVIQTRIQNIEDSGLLAGYEPQQPEPVSLKMINEKVQRGNYTKIEQEAQLFEMRPVS